MYAITTVIASFIGYSSPKSEIIMYTKYTIEFRLELEDIYSATYAEVYDLMVEYRRKLEEVTKPLVLKSSTIHHTE